MVWLQGVTARRWQLWLATALTLPKSLEEQLNKEEALNKPESMSPPPRDPKRVSLLR